eukprot:s196_g39.t1
MPSGRSENLSLPQSSKVGDLRILAQKAFGHGVLRLLTADGQSLDSSVSLETAGLQDGDQLTVLVLQRYLAATREAFALWCCGGDRIVTWGHPDCGSDNSAVQHQLRSVEQVQATGDAFAAILADGSVVT